MIKKRNRFKQTTTLEQRLAKFSTDLHHQAGALPPQTAEARQLQWKIKQTEAARRLNESLAMPAGKS